jgi:hypothetical protein
MHYFSHGVTRRLILLISVSELEKYSDKITTCREPAFYAVVFRYKEICNSTIVIEFSHFIELSEACMARSFSYCCL